MNVLAINGSPRKKWNTATLLEKSLEGAASVGAETELVHLYDLDFKGCTSCFACKLKGGKSYGKCAMKDGLTPILEKLVNTDVLILGSGEHLSQLNKLERPETIRNRYYSPDVCINAARILGSAVTVNETLWCCYGAV
jgi:hypothetical protein